MLNYIWLGFLLIAVLVGGFTGKLPDMTKGAFETAESAVMKIALPLVGVMAIWMGIMRLAERSGLVQLIARVLRPLLVRLFPEVPADHPAMGAMVMNMAANMLGLGNAATPLGLRAMGLLEKLNPRPGVASNAMCTFLALNTASIQIVPTTAIGLLAIAGAKNPSAIVPAAFLATVIAAFSGVAATKILERLPLFRLQPAPEPSAPTQAAPGEADPAEPPAETLETTPLTPARRIVLLLFVAAFGLMGAWLIFPSFTIANYAPPPVASLAGKPLPIRALLSVAILAVPFMLSFFPLYAAMRGVKVYEQFVEGAKEAFGVGQRIIAYLVAMLVAVRLLREAGVIDLLTKHLTSTLEKIHFPAELLPMVLMRPLSGSGTQGIFVDLINRTGPGFGPDELLSRMAATIYGSTETTFYVVAVYFGSVAVRQTRHAILAGLFADTVAVVASIAICRWLFA